MASDEATPKATKQTKQTRAFRLASERYQMGRRDRGLYARRGDVTFSLGPRSRDSLRADLRAMWREACDDDPPGDPVLNGVIADLRRLAENAEPDAPTSAETAMAIVNAHGVTPTWNPEHPERPEVHSANRNPFDAAREVADLLLKGNDPPRLFRMGREGTAVVQVLDDGTLMSLDQNMGGGWLMYVAERVTFIGGGETPRIVAPPAPVMKMMPTIILSDLPVLDGLTTTPYLDADGDLITQDGYHPGSRLYLTTRGLDLAPISEKPTAAEVAAARDLLMDEWLGDFPFATPADKANAVAELLTLTGRSFVRLAPLFINDASTPGSGKGLLTDTVHLIATGHLPHLMELPLDGDEQRKTITSALMAGQSLIAWDESPLIAGRTLAMILTAEIYSARILGTNKMIAVQNRFTQIAIGNNVDVRGDMRRRVLPCRLEPDVDRPEHRSGFRHPDLKAWVGEQRSELLHAALTIWRHWDAEGRPTYAKTIGSFDHWVKTVGGALDAAGIPDFATNIDKWLSYSEEDDGWGGHLIQLRARYDAAWFTVNEVADAVHSGYLRKPPVKRDDKDRELSQQISYAYRGLRERWYGELRLVRSETRNSESGGYTWSVRKREDREKSGVPTGQDPCSVSSVSSAGGVESAGQTHNGVAPEGTPHGLTDGTSSGAVTHLQNREATGQSQFTERTEDTEHLTRVPAPNFHSSSARLDCSMTEGSTPDRFSRLPSDDDEPDDRWSEYDNAPPDFEPWDDPDAAPEGDHR